MGKYTIIFIVVAMICFAVNENIVVMAQSNSTNSEKRTIIVTWLDTNNTKTESIPMFTIGNEEFWKIFKPLLEQSVNESTD